MLSNDTSMLLSEDGMVKLNTIDGSNFEGTGTWIAKGPVITINFSTNDTPPKEIIMVGYMSSSNGIPLVKFKGEWGTGLSSDNDIETLMGRFRFEND